MKIISIILIAVSAFLSLKHGWDAFQNVGPEQAKMMSELGISKALFPYFGALSIIVGVMLLSHKHFLLVIY